VVSTVRRGIGNARQAVAGIASGRVSEAGGIVMGSSIGSHSSAHAGQQCSGWSVPSATETR